jgi:hypothetical protein
MAMSGVFEMNRSLSFLGTAALAAIVSISFSLTAARAATVVDFTITEESGYDISGDLSFTLGAESSGTYPITSVSGTISGSGFSETINSSSSPNGYYGAGLGGNVLLNTSGTYAILNDFGVSVTLANGDEINIVPDSSPYYWVDAYTGSDSAIYEQPFTLTESVSTTPLPAALPMFAGGLGMVGFLARRKKQKAEKALAAAA